MERVLQLLSLRAALFYGPFLYFAWEAINLIAVAPRPRPAVRAVFSTAHLQFIYWVLFWTFLIGRPAWDRRRRLLPLRGVRLVWLFGWLMLVLHTVAVFELFFGWSHAAAYEDTRRGSGVGWGVFVNYLVLLVWGADAAWLLASPAGYGERPGWVGWAVHGLIAFVMFNATVVYGGEFARTWGLIGFGLLAVIGAWRWWAWRLGERGA